MVKALGKTVRVWLRVPLASDVTLGKDLASLRLCDTFPKSTVRVIEMVFVSWLAQSLAQSKCLVTAQYFIHDPELGKTQVLPSRLSFSGGGDGHLQEQP